MKQNTKRISAYREQRAFGANAAALFVIFGALLFLSACSGESGPAPDVPVVRSASLKRSRASSIYSRVHRRAGRLGPAGGTLGLQDRFEYPQVPRVHHPEVKKFVDLYTGSRRSYIEEALGRRARVISLVEGILFQYGLPKELAYIAFIESRFNPNARCKDGSTIGLWQLSRATARNYGLRVDKVRDERLDVRKSSEAAARFLASLYDTFGDWYLAAAAYNAGPYRVEKALDQVGESIDVHRLDFFALTSQGILSEITREFVAKLGALVIIGDEFSQYGFTIPEPLPVSDTSVKAKK